MRKIYFLTTAILLSSNLFSQFSLVLPGTYSQNFDNLGTGTSSPAGGDLNIVNAGLNGWYFLETGTNANTTITAGTGSSATGDTYNFGSNLAADRTLGGLQSGTVNPTFGFYFTNNTGSTVTSLAISYTGEEWRLGATGRGKPDTLNFQYSLDATSLSSGNWVDADALDYTTTDISGTLGSRDGNNASYRTSGITGTLTVNIANGSTCFIRWSDANVTGSDDGLGVDDFSLTAGFAAASTDYFRSKQTGLWDAVSTWESSPDNATWANATAVPTSSANTITIQNGHTVSYASFLPVDQVVIANGGILKYTQGGLNINDGAGTDIDIQNGGIFDFLSSNISTVAGSWSVAVNSGAMIRLSIAGLTTTAGQGVHSGKFDYKDQSILEYTLTGGFGTDNITYFPNAAANVIPIFRTTGNGNTIVGADNPTVINGIFEVNNSSGNIIWQNNGNITFRNGIRGTKSIDGSSKGAGKFVINGTTAELGGAGGLTLSAAGLEIGNTAPSAVTVTMSSDKTITGNVSLTGANTYVDAGTYNLTITGTVSGGQTDRYIRTQSTGSLILNGVAGAKTFPIGHSYYMPLIINNPDNYNWTANVNDGVTADTWGTTNGAVLATWYITPSTNPPTATTLTFEFDSAFAAGQTGPNFNDVSHVNENVQIWHRKLGYWLAAGASLLTQVSGTRMSATASGLTSFSPYGISKITLPLPLKLLDFNALKISNSKSIITWELANFSSATDKMDVEKSADGINFAAIATVPGNETTRYYSVNDNALAKGITYYRLKMTAADGKISYSKTVAVINDTKGLLITSLSPNPVTDKAILGLSAAAGGTVTMDVYNMAGAKVRQWRFTVTEGNNNLVLPAEGLPKGIYQVLASTGADKIGFRIMKQ